MSQSLRERLTALGITPAESALLNAVHFGLTNPLADLPRTAAGPDYSLAGPVSEEECRQALASCLRKGWLRVIDPSARAEIEAELGAHGILGPVYGLPDNGGVDFSARGVDLWFQLTEGEKQSMAIVDPSPLRRVLFATDFAALAGERESYEACGGQIVSWQSTAIGPWCVYWWERHPAGFRADIGFARKPDF